ncbi:hypothetical protein SELMODRAFT_430170 [Selaginella moellendorffii]|uniref:Uncharacterized protein n=1 Tax=Selaginella moellendorffii TaxID=88036 RepID=D8T8K4_SELML|nr:hypothetical protein SELMODRAFT_430170 [Selaginella moellendorffii]
MYRCESYGWIQQARAFGSDAWHVLKDVVEMPVLAYAESITACKVASGAELKVSMTPSISPFVAAKPSQDIPGGNSSKQSSCLIAIFWAFASIRAVHDTFCGTIKP